METGAGTESEVVLIDDSRASQLHELAAIVESSEDAIISKDLDGKIRSWNNGAERLYGFACDEVIGKSIAILAPPDREDEIPMIIARIKRGERVEHFETRRRHKEGHDVYVSLTVSPVRDVDGEIVAASIIARDLTARYEAERALQESEQRLQAALAESRRSQQAAELARREAETLSRLLEDISAVVHVAHAHSTVEELLRGLTEYVHDRLGADATSILLVDDEEKFERHFAVGFDDELTLGVFETLSQSLIHRIVERVAPIVLENASGIGESRIAGIGVQSLVGVPLVVQGELIGSLCSGRRDHGAFPASDVEFLRLTADRAAVAIENARLYEKAMSVAETLQRSLLPKRLPLSPSAQAAARYLPAAHGVQVGGDWYDVAELPGGKFSLTVGDVVGHGIEAASLMGRIRHVLRALVLEGHGPASAIEQLERVTALEDRGMATLVCVVVDPRTRRARFASAGHPPPLLLRPDGSAIYLEGGRSVPIGAVDAAVYVEDEVAIDPGSTILLYTDGLVERRGASIDDGLDMLLRSAVRGPNDVDALLSHLIADLVGRYHPVDDIALLAFRLS